MCFAIPYRIEKIDKNCVIVEGGKKIKIDNNLKVKTGDYLQITGNMAIEKISRDKAIKLRKLIKRLYENQ